MKKSFYTILILLLILSLGGCGNSDEIKKIKKDSLEFAKEYYKDKYEEPLVLDDYSIDVIREDRLGYPLPIAGEPYNKAIIENISDGYSIFVNLDDKVAADNKQINEIKYDLKDYIEKEYLLKNGIDLNFNILDKKIYRTYSKFMIYALDTDDYSYYTGNINSHDYIYSRGFLNKDSYYNGDIKEFINNNKLSLVLEMYLQANKEEYSVEELNHYREKFNLVLEDIKRDFDGANTNIELYLYKQDKYMNDEVLSTISKMMDDTAEKEDYKVFKEDYVYYTYNLRKDYGDSSLWKLEIYDYADESLTNIE